MKYRVIFSPEAEEQLVSLYTHIADAASPDIAKRYTDGIIRYCESLHAFPIRGTVREDVRPGLRSDFQSILAVFRILFIRF